jgi:hypothetical protein
MVCAGNIDEDDTLDVRGISTQARTGPNGKRYEPGEVFLLVDDTER